MPLRIGGSGVQKKAWEYLGRSSSGYTKDMVGMKLKSYAYKRILQQSFARHRELFVV